VRKPLLVDSPADAGPEAAAAAFVIESGVAASGKLG
jgi:hypothetical protein